MLLTHLEGASNDHSTRERDPPPRPIPLEFPSYVPPFAPRKLDASLSSRIRNKICHIRTFTEISDEDLSSLNAHFEKDVDVSALLPHEGFRSRPLLFDDDLEAMITEISVDNQDAFREILRMDPLPGRQKPRLAYARNFFGSLEDMARYFDNSNDQYYFIPNDKGKASKIQAEDKANGSSTPKSKDTDIEMNDADAMADSKAASVSTEKNSASSEMKEVYKGYRFGNAEQVNPGSRVALVKNLMKMVMYKFTCRDHEPMPSPREKLVFRGVKIQSIQYHFCVARIPKDSKLARARMVEGPLMAAHVREDVRFKSNSRISLHDAASAQEAEGGAAASAAKSTNAIVSKPPVSGPTFVGEKFDFFRELGCMLILAAQREREGKAKDSISGADKWWVTEKRWGGGPTHWGQLASEIYEDEDPSLSPEERRLQEEKRQREVEEKARPKDGKEPMNLDNISVDDLMASNAPTIPGVPGDPLLGPRKKKLRSLERPPGKEQEMRDGKLLAYVPPFRKKWYQDWQKLRPNTPMWDDKIIYSHIGKDKNSEFDEVFMVTAVNHHVALLRMRVHPDYVAWIESGKEVLDEEGPEGLKKNVLYVQRSGWYDMFDIPSRKQFLTALWGVMSWINRDHLDKAEFEKLEAKTKAQ